MIPALALIGALGVHDDTFGARDCLALTVYSEARSESVLGQILVAQTVVNRTIANQTDVCSETEREGQYHGVERWAFPRRPKGPAWRFARTVADYVIEGGYLDVYCGQPHYFYSGKRQKWMNTKTTLCTVGEHTFLGK